MFDDNETFIMPDIMTAIISVIQFSRFGTHASIISRSIKCVATSTHLTDVKYCKDLSQNGI